MAFAKTQDLQSKDISVFLVKGINVLSKVGKDDLSVGAMSRVDEPGGPTSKHSLTLLSCFIHIIQTSSFNTTSNNLPRQSILHNTIRRRHQNNTVNLFGQPTNR